MRAPKKLSWLFLALLPLTIGGCGGGGGSQTPTSSGATLTASSLLGTWKLMSATPNSSTVPIDMSATGITIRIDASTMTFTLPAATTISGRSFAACTETDSWTLNGSTITSTVTVSPVNGSLCDPVGKVTTGTVAVNGNTLSTIGPLGNVNTYALQTTAITAAPSTAGTSWSLASIAGYSIPSLRIVRNLNNQWIAAGFSNLLTMNGNLVNNTITIPTTGWVYGTAYGNGIYVAGGSSNTIITSPDAINWTARVSAFSGSFVDIAAVAFGNGRFVAVSGGANNSWSLSTDQIQTSTDGLNWTAVDMTAHRVAASGGTFPPAVRCITFGNGQFIAAGNDGTTFDAAIFTSTDGITWVKQNTGLPTGNFAGLTSVKFAGGQYIAVGPNGLVLTSPDGVTWTKRTAVTPNVLRDVAYGNGKYVAVGDTGTMIESSDSGITWTALPALTTQLLNSIDFANNQFIVAGNYVLITSP